MELLPFWNFIREFEEAYDYHRKKIMKSFELSAIEVDVLAFVSNNPSLNTAADVVRYKKIAKSHVSLAVKSLIDKGYLRKEVDEKDKKKYHLIPCEKAEVIVDFARRERDEFIKVIDQSITEEDKQSFREVMLKIENSLKKEYELKEK
ncbi:MAG: MarR family transcriptional regulator [Erysipelotrichaceae bacterium]|nr:MarR family transcriptional regulator [Erysipelotrichaceae bacterium]